MSNPSLGKRRAVQARAQSGPGTQGRVPRPDWIFSTLALAACLQTYEPGTCGQGCGRARGQGTQEETLAGILCP